MSSVGVWVLISCVCIAYGILSLLHQFYISMFSVVVPGTVIDNVKGRSYQVIGMNGQYRSGGTVGASTVSFQPRGSAQPVTVQMLGCRRVGSQVQVIYLPGKLRSADFYTKEPVFSRWIQPCLLLGLGLLMASITVLPLLGINLW